MKVPEHYRDRVHPGLASDSSYGNNGLFVIPHPSIDDYLLTCIVSDGGGWEHVSITLHQKVSQTRRKAVKRTPTWSEMCYVKSLFWDDEEAVMQLHPLKSQHVNRHDYCLHLWRPVRQDIPLPPPGLVG